MCRLGVLEALPTLNYHFSLTSHLFALRMALLIYLLTLPPNLLRHRLDMAIFVFFVKNACIKKPCPNNTICQAGSSSEGYRCVCVPGYVGKDCTKGDTDICFHYLIVSSYLMIRRVDDRLFYLKSLALSSCIYFLVEDKEGPAVNCEKNLRKR